MEKITKPRKLESTQMWVWPQKNEALEAARKERVKEYGSFLYCPAQDCLCCNIDNEDGICSREDCLLNDEDYIREKEKQRERQNRQIDENLAEAADEKEAQKNIRFQKAVPYKQWLEVEIERKKKKAIDLYRRGRTKQGDNVELEIINLYSKLEKVEAKK